MLFIHKLNVVDTADCKSVTPVKIITCFKILFTITIKEYVTHSFTTQLMTMNQNDRRLAASYVDSIK